jgi:hypothetical protein
VSSYAGVAKIIRFNWPWYVLGLAVTGGALIYLGSHPTVTSWRGAGGLAVALAGGWLLGSLLVSHYLYDRSAVARGEWIGAVERADVRTAVVLHAGQDEASEVVRRAISWATLEAFDFYDPRAISSPSLERARRMAGTGARFFALAAAQGEFTSADLVLLVFAAHELRERDDRVELLAGAGRMLSDKGRLLVVEHLRDAWNFLAYGPGAFHFLSRRTWLDTFEAARLSVLEERRCTRFVRVFVLTRGV